jgi:hypothetical protein
MDDSGDESRPLMADNERDDSVERGVGTGNGAGAGAGAKVNVTSTTTPAVPAGSNRSRGPPQPDDAGHPDAPLDTVDPLQLDENSSSNSENPTPRFLRDDASKRWRWVPFPVRRFLRAVAVWSKGPANPQPYRIKPLFPRVQEFPLQIIRRVLPDPRHRLWLTLAYLSIWLITFVLVKRQETQATDIAGWGQPQKIGCGVTYWGAGNSCGLDGNECRPFSSGGFAFRCDADCESHHVLNPRAVGDQEVIYAPLIVGGPPDDAQSEKAFYRSDSFVCGAAVHAGVISNQDGGCGVVKLVGNRRNYVSSERNGIKTFGFDSYFPSSFEFVENTNCTSTDNRWPLLAVSSVFSGVMSLFTSSPALFFFANFVGIFWTVGMSLDPPPHTSVTSLFSNILGKFLPAMFCAWVMYDKMGVRRVLKGLRAQIEKSVLWLGACWVGALDNYTLSFIPIQRLNAHDLKQQPGAKAALSIIIIVLAVVIVGQVWFFRQEGRFLRYIRLYGLFVAAIVIALLLPGLNLRIHHYILALLLLPGTSIQVRPSLLYQGLLVGLFINGIARWGFDPVLQTSAALQGDAQKGSMLPTIHDPVISLANGSDATSNISFTWDIPTQKRYDGISILVNDVERYRSYFYDDFDGGDKFIWSRNKTLGVPEYFRFAFMDGSSSGDYTKAGKWTSDGEWVQMKPGPSRVKVRSIDEPERLKR